MRNSTYAFAIDNIGANKRRLPIEIEVGIVSVKDQHNAAGIAINHIEGLLQMQTQEKIIEGMYSEYDIVMIGNWQIYFVLRKKLLELRGTPVSCSLN